MILVINIGNSSISAGLHGIGGWTEHRRYSTDERKTADEYLVLFRASFGEKALASSDRVAVSTVVPELEKTFEDFGLRLLGKPPFVVRPRHRAGLEVAIDNPEELGTDLLADAVAGYDRCGGSCIIVDFGTALTFTAVEKGGIVRGAAIAPGIGSAVKALSSSTAKLPRVPIEAPVKAIGTDTVASIQSGIVLGYAGLTESMISRMKKELPPPVTVIATGGQATVMADLVPCFDVVDPWITLDGIRLIAEREGGMR